MLREFCDRCGKEADARQKQEFPCYAIDKISFPGEHEMISLCPDCEREFEKWLTWNPNKERNLEESAGQAIRKAAKECSEKERDESKPTPEQIQERTERMRKIPEPIKQMHEGIFNLAIGIWKDEQERARRELSEFEQRYRHGQYLTKTCAEFPYSSERGGTPWK